MNLQALKSPAFRNYIISLHLALNGFWAQRVIVGWLAWELTESPSFVGLVAFLNFVPTLFVSPLFGVVADRIDVRWGSIISYGCAGTISGLFACMGLLGWVGPAMLAGFSLLTGMISSANHPMRMSLTPRLAPADQLPSVVALTALNFNLSRLIGPAVGGLLIHALGASMALVFTAATYAAPVLAMWFMKPRERARTAGAGESGYFGALLDGWRYALERRLIRSAIIFIGIASIAGRSVLETLPVLSSGVFDMGPAGLGLMTAAAGAGAAAASIFKALTQAQRAGIMPRHVLAMVFLVPLLVASLTVIGSFDLAMLIVLFLGAATTLVAVSLQSLVQMEIGDDYRGRVMGLWTTISIGSGAFGAILMGLLIDWAGVTGAQAIIGLSLAGLTAVEVLRFRSQERLTG